MDYSSKFIFRKLISCGEDEVFALASSPCLDDEERVNRNPDHTEFSYVCYIKGGSGRLIARVDRRIEAFTLAENGTLYLVGPGLPGLIEIQDGHFRAVHITGARSLLDVCRVDDALLALGESQDRHPFLAIYSEGEWKTYSSSTIRFEYLYVAMLTPLQNGQAFLYFKGQTREGKNQISFQYDGQSLCEKPIVSSKLETAVSPVFDSIPLNISTSFLDIPADRDRIFLDHKII